MVDARSACAERLPFTTFTAFDGRVYTDVNVVVEDRQGFLWLGTEKGLERFDGRTFRHFGKDHGLTKTNVTSLAVAADGALWVGSWGAVFRFDPAGGGSFTEVPVHGNKIPLERTLVFVDAKEQVWCVGDFLYRLEPGPSPAFHRAQFEPATSMQWVTGFLPDRSGNLWVGGFEGLYRVSAQGVVSIMANSEEPSPRHIQSIVEDVKGRIWFVTPKGVWWIEGTSSGAPAGLVMRSVFTGEVTTPLVPRPGGGIWVGVREGLLEISGDRTILRRIGKEHGLAALPAWPRLIDHAGGLWVTSMTGSLQRLPAVGFSSFGADDGLAAPIVRAIWRRRSGDLIVNGYPDVLQRFDGQRFIPTAPLLPPAVSPSWGWYQVDLEDREGHWWIPGASALLRFSPVERLEHLARAKPMTVYRATGCFPSGDIFRLYEDSNGDIWIGTITRDQETLYRWNRASDQFSCYRSRDIVGTGVAPTAFLDDGRGTLWIGFYHGQVARYHGGRFECVFDCSGRNGLVYSLHHDRRGRLWIGTYRSGVLRVDDPTAARPAAVNLTTAQGLSSNRIGGITEDRFGRIYIGTDSGVDVLEESKRIRHFGTAEGLPHPFAGVAYADPDGEIWLGTLNGVARFTPPAEFRDEGAPRVMIDGVRVSGRERPVSAAAAAQLDGFVLGPDERDISIDYVGLPWTSAESLKFQYRLSENEPWSPPSANRSVVLAGLNAGRYRLEIRALDAAGRASAHVAAVSFQALPPIYRRAWFLAFGMAAIVGFMMLAYRARVRHLLELERERTRIAMDLHDEMGSRLGSIALLADVATQETLAETRRSHLLGQIAETAAEMGSSLTEIIWSLRRQTISLERVAQYLTAHGARLFPGPTPAFVTRFPAEWPAVDMPHATGRAVLLAGQEALHNSARHAQAGTVILQLEPLGRRWRLTVEDDGRGVREKDGPTIGEGFGLESMRRRAAEIGAALHIDGADGRGTTVQLVFDPRARPRDRMNIRRTWKRPWDRT
jgi:ligand-binding sensor domain-containing protein/signal transduction histidine kinase